MKVTLKQRIYNKLPEGKRDKIVKTYHVLRTIKNVVCWTMVAVLASTLAKATSRTSSTSSRS